MSQFGDLLAPQIGAPERVTVTLPRITPGSSAVDLKRTIAQLGGIPAAARALVPLNPGVKLKSLERRLQRQVTEAGQKRGAGKKSAAQLQTVSERSTRKRSKQMQKLAAGADITIAGELVISSDSRYRTLPTIYLGPEIMGPFVDRWLTDPDAAGEQLFMDAVDSYGAASLQPDGDTALDTFDIEPAE